MSIDTSHRHMQVSKLEIEELMDRLDSEPSYQTNINQRAEPRVSFRMSDVPIVINHPGGTSADCLVWLRDISALGISFIYWGFLHPDTTFEIALSDMRGDTHPVTGRVKWCKHVKGIYHVIGAEFDTQIDLKIYLPPDQWAILLGDSSENQSDLRGRILAIDDQKMDRDLLKYHIELSGLTLTVVSCGGEAIDALKQDTYDLVICDLNLENATGEEVMRAIRELGFAGPIIVLTVEADANRLKSAKAAGGSIIIHKPYNPDKFLVIITELLKSEGVNADSQLLFSQLGDEPAVVNLVNSYIAEVKDTILDLKRDIKHNNINAVRKHCLGLKGTGTGYGFPDLSDAASQAVTALDSSLSISESMALLVRLESLSNRLRAGRAIAV